MLSNHIEHIFFDLDDTLWDIEKNSRMALSELFEELSLGKLLYTDFETFFIAYRKKNAELWELYSRNKISKESLRVRRFKETFEGFAPISDDICLYMAEEYIKKGPLGTELRPGARELLEKWSKEYSLHIITNGFKEAQYVKLKSSKLDAYFKQVIISEEVGHNKPDVKIFRAAEQLSGAKPLNSLMIGDNFETDIKGAKKAGWKSIWYNPHNNKRYSGEQVSCLTQFL